jgi:TolB-like protein/predicted Zn-dependent protease
VDPVSEAPASVEFGRFRILPYRREVLADGRPIELGGRAFDVLMALIEANGTVVSKDELVSRVWPSRIIEEGNLRAQIRALRIALGDRDLIRTVAGRGYQFTAEVRSSRGTDRAPPEHEATAGLTVIETPQPPLPPLERPSIAVLPFDNMSGDPDQEYFADGMVEEIITALSRVRSFFVIARNSSFIYKNRAVDVKQVGRELGVRYVLEGGVRRAGGRVRITAQLVEASTGNHLWADRYDREVHDIFAVQDEITERIVAVIEPELYAAEHVRSQRKPPDSLDAWECVIRALSCLGQGTCAGNTQAEALCRRAIAIAPGYGQAHSLLAWVLARGTDWSGDIRTVLPEATSAARTALGLDERDPWAQLAHGTVLWRTRRNEESERVLRRALELNPNFALAHALRARPLAIGGAHEEAVKSAEHALRLSPRDPLVGTYASFAIALAHFAAGRYAECIEWARNTIARTPEYSPPHTLLAAAAALQGESETAAEALAARLRLRPDLSLGWIGDNLPFAGEVGERWLEGLRKAGVPTVTDRGHQFTAEVRLRRGRGQGPIEQRVTDGAPAVPPRLSIVVLPFVNLSDDREQQYFADGITEDLTADLSRLADILVISRNTAFTYRDKTVDTKQIGRELGVRYVLEGSVRRSGNRVRVSAQLIDAETDTHLWTERLDSDSRDLFALQNEITSRIAVALNLELIGADAARPTEHPDALEYIVRGRAVSYRPSSRDKYAESIALFERALTLSPHSVAAQSYAAIYLAGRVLDQLTDSAAADMARAETLAAQALTAAPRSPLAHFAKANVLRARGRYAEAIPEYEAVLALDRNWVSAHAHLGQCKLFTGSIEETIPLQERAIRLSPRDPQIGIYLARIGLVHLLESRIDEAILWLERARRTNPRLPHVRCHLASAYGLKGEIERASAELAEARKLCSDDRHSSIVKLLKAGQTVSAYWGVPKIRALFETTYFVGLRKAGMPEE